MIEKLISVVMTASSESEALKAIARLAVETTQLSDEDVDQLLAQLAELSISDSVTPLSDDEGNWKPRLDLLIPITQSLLVRELKQIKNSKPGDEIAMAWDGSRLQNFETLYLAVAPDS